MPLLRYFVPALALTISCFVQPAQAGSCDDAGKYMQRIGDQALAVISNKNFSKDQKQKQLEKIFSSSVDIGWVGKFVMGRHWRTATDAQKARYLKKYERFLVLHYTSRFADYAGGSFTLTGAKADENGDCTVNMSLKGDKPGDEPVLVDYRLHKSGARIFDVVVEGVSLITTQRSEFASVIDSHGIDYLIDKLDSMSVTAPEKQ